MPFSVRLAAEITPLTSQQMRDKLTAEKEIPGLNVIARHGEQQTVQLLLPFFQQCSIQAKMQKSHAHMATLDISMLC